MTLYLAAFILKPTPKERHDSGATETVVGGGPYLVLATDERQASIKAMQYVTDDLKDKLDRLEVRLLPFRA